MGCASSKKPIKRPTLVEAAAIETANELRAAAEEFSAPQTVYAVPASNPSPIAKLERSAASASGARGATEKARKGNSEMEGNRQFTTEKDDGATDVSLIGLPRALALSESSGETPKELKGTHPHPDYRGGILRSGKSLSLAADTKHDSYYSSSTRSDSSGSARGHKSENSREQIKEKRSNSGSIDFEVWSKENEDDSVINGHPHSSPPLQATETGSSINGVTGASTASATNSRQEKRSASHQKSSSSSSAFQNYALPSETEAKMGPDAGTQGNGAGSEGSTSRCSSPAVPASITSVQSEQTLLGAPSMSLRGSFEPYSDFGLRGGDDYLPPYEWAPRTFPVPCSLQASDRSDMAHWGYGENPFCEVGATGCFQDPTANIAHDGVSTPEPTTAEGNDAASPPLTLHNFYPCLPPAQPPSSRVEVRVSVPGASQETYNFPPLPVDAPAQQAHSQQQRTYQTIYECDADACYSPAEYVTNGAMPRRAVPPSLVDILVSEEGSYAPPAPVSALYTFYPSPSPVQTQHTCKVLGGGSDKPITYLHAFPVMTTAAPHLHDGGDRSRDANISGADPGVNAHQYKPVTYLFDSPADDWLPSRHVPSPQRALYAAAVDMW